MTDRELMQQALDALEKHIFEYETIEALRARLAQPEPEPVAWVWVVNSGAGYYTKGVGFDKTDIPFAKHTPLYTAPPQREWQGLTDEEIREFEIWLDDEEEKHGWNPPADIVKHIEAKLKEKNNG